jgi:hypothetical protein
MCCGSVKAADFVKQSAYAAAAKIDMSSCQFEEAPVIFTSMNVQREGRRYLNSASNIINAKPNELDPTEATVMVRSEFSLDEHPDWLGTWTLQWCAYGIVRPCPVEPTFDVSNAKCYADRYPDLKAAFGYNVANLIQHFKVSGQNEGRVFNCLCSAEPVLEPTLTGGYSIDNAKCYADRYTDLKGAFGYNVKALIAHYNEYGMKEGRTFNCNWKDPLADYPSYETCCGSSNSKWENGGTDIVLPVDTSGCGWTKGSAPMYFTSMSDTTCGAELFTSTPRCAARAIGYQGIYDAGVKGFTVKAKPIPGTNLPSPADAANYNWQVKWCAVRPFSKKAGADNEAGFPCTSPRLLKGTGDQGVFSNVGKVCCDTSSSSGWRGAGADSVQKTIDISQCGFNKISYLFTNVRGDGPVDQMIGSSAYSPTKSKNQYVVYLYTGGKYMYWKAAQYNFRVQWCAYGR